VINLFENRSFNQDTTKFTRVVYTSLVATSFKVGMERKLKNVQPTRSKDVSKGETQFKIYLRNYF